MRSQFVSLVAGLSLRQTAPPAPSLARGRNFITLLNAVSVSLRRGARLLLALVFWFTFEGSYTDLNEAPCDFCVVVV